MARGPARAPLQARLLSPLFHPWGVHTGLVGCPCRSLSPLTCPYLILQVPENYFYVPDLGQVPEIDVPSYLPDLPGIANDLMYSADLGPGIAPSAPGTIPELPTFHTEVAEPLKTGELGSGMRAGLGTSLPTYLLP